MEIKIDKIVIFRRKYHQDVIYLKTQIKGPLEFYSNLDLEFKCSQHQTSEYLATNFPDIPIEVIDG